MGLSGDGRVPVLASPWLGTHTSCVLASLEGDDVCFEGKQLLIHYVCNCFLPRAFQMNSTP